MQAQGIYEPDTIHLKNPSIEGYPRASFPPNGWWDCGFPGESPPDVQPFRSTNSERWGQQIVAVDGDTYLGMVVRDNETWERVAQRLEEPLLQDKCYTLELFLCQSDLYLSTSRKTNKEAYYNEPAVLRIWAASGLCGQHELLGETVRINHKEWRSYSFEFRPRQTYRYIMIEAYYKTPVLIPYNGNILVDYISPIIRIPCPDEEIALEEEVVSGPVVEEIKQEETLTASVTSQPDVPEKEKTLKSLEREKVEIGETIRIEKLHFKADSSVINKEAYPVLDEIVAFLADNPDIRVEIGGHTSFRRNKEGHGMSKAYSEKLSSARARSVAIYMYRKGVPPDQLIYKGYGFTEPIANNFTESGRKKNQRVEIKILSMGG